MNITNAKTETKTWPLWQQAFRPFFLFGSIFGIVAMCLWLSSLSGHLFFSPFTNILFWHAHEMIFGFVGAFVVGFLLTAVQNWTGLRATHGIPLLLLLLLWLSARFLMAVNIGINEWIIAAIDTSFYLAAALLMAKLVLTTKNTRNLVFVPVLLLLAGFNLISYIGMINDNIQHVNQGLYAAVMQITLMMVIIAGRVLPMFTANGTGTQKQLPLKWLEHACIGLSIVLVLIFMFDLHNKINPLLLAGLFTLASLCNAFRALRWRPWITLSVPLVWSLHIAYWFIPVGYSLFALHYLRFSITLSSSIHALTVGAMSGLILAMISRISLGHTGRMLKIHHSMAFAFSFIAIAGLVRIFITSVPQIPLNLGYLVAGTLWIIAYCIFLINYTSILVTPRIDGKIG